MPVVSPVCVSRLVRGESQERSSTLPGKGLGMCPNFPILLSSPKSGGPRGVEAGPYSGLYAARIAVVLQKHGLRAIHYAHLRRAE